MRKKNILKEEQRHRMMEMSGINNLQGQTLISVDIQEEYKNYFSFNPTQFGQMINENYKYLNSLIFLYNGPELGFPDENEYKFWLMEYCEIDEDVINNATFYDKGYAFFRYCMDNDIEDDELVDFIKFMINNNITDSRDINDDTWNDFINQYGHNDIRELLESADDLINIPELMDELKNYNGRLMLCGGGINECLKEVELALMALDKPYNVLTKFTY